jgi:hypothetical protein
MNYHAMLSLYFDLNVPASTVITMARGMGGTLRPADSASDLKVDGMRLQFIMDMAERDMYEIYCDQMRDSGAWEP